MYPQNDSVIKSEYSVFQRKDLCFTGTAVTNFLFFLEISFPVMSVQNFLSSQDLDQRCHV